MAATLNHGGRLRFSLMLAFVAGKITQEVMAAGLTDHPWTVRELLEQAAALAA